LSLKISHFRLLEAPEFVAISYTWGKDANPRCVTVNECHLEVQGNCWVALSQCKERRIQKYIWIDSICIDQSNVEEKSDQVPMMGSIYPQALRVMVSISQFQDECMSKPTNDAFLESVEIMAAIISSQEFDLADILMDLEGEKADKVYRLGVQRFAGQKRLLHEGLSKVANAQYWTRLWILQELVKAKQTYLMYYGETVNLVLLWVLLRIYEDLKEDLETSPDESGDTDQYISTLRDVLILAFTRDRDSNKELRSAKVYRSLAGVLVRFRYAGCSDPRDRIYGTMSFVESPGKTPLRTDYNLSTVELAMRLMDYREDMNVVQFVHILVETLRIRVDDLEQFEQSSSSKSTPLVVGTPL
jgi:hypothetical protein